MTTSRRAQRKRGLAILLGIAILAAAAIWLCLRTGEDAAFSFRGHTATVAAVAFSPDGGRLASASDDGTVRMWQFDPPGRLLDLRSAGTEPSVLQFSLGGSELCAAYHNGLYWAVDAFSGRELHRCRTSVWGWALARNVPWALAYNREGQIEFWEIARCEPVRAVDDGNCSAYWAVAISDDGAYGVTGRRDGGISFWDLTTGRMVQALPRCAADPTCLTFAPDGKTLLSGHRDGTVRLWDVDGGGQISCLLGHTGEVRCIAASPDGWRGASGGVDGTVRLWDLARGQPLQVFRGNRDWVYCVAFSADGEMVAAGGGLPYGTSYSVREGDNVVRCWKLGDWRADP